MNFMRNNLSYPQSSVENSVFWYQNSQKKISLIYWLIISKWTGNRPKIYTILILNPYDWWNSFVQRIRQKKKKKNCLCLLVLNSLTWFSIEICFFLSFFFSLVLKITTPHSITNFRAFYYSNFQFISFELN